MYLFLFLTKGMFKQTKQIDRQKRKFQFKLLFLLFSIQNCFTEADANKQPFDKCKADAKDRMDKYIREFFDSVKN